MRGELVSIDLETTGLDTANDAIIEVGAVRMKSGKVIDEFSTMVNPDIAIPPATTHLTGIQQKDVQGAPNIKQVLPQIEDFVRGAPVIAHNTSLDMGFLQDRYRILTDSPRIDTYDLAAVLLPSVPRYNLNSLTQHFNIDLTNSHRALDDARATALLYWELWQHALKLPRYVVQQIYSAATGIDWDATIVFEAALKELPAEAHNGTSPAPSLTDNVDLDEVNGTSEQPQQPVKKDEVDAILGETGQLARSLPDFTYREPQLQMAHAITDAFDRGDHLLVEAGTGTGKSLAYLIPAVLWATRNKTHVVISTNTINLQDQLINHDIPALREALGIDFKASVMKGRSNYLAPHRLEAALRRGPSSVVELRTLAKVLVWRLENNTGDKSDISLRGPGEHAVWHTISADDTSSITMCDDPAFYDTPFCRARRQAEASHIIIVNHALLIADARTRHAVLPNYDHLVIDEAHHLEDAITEGLSYRLDQNALQRQIVTLGNPSRGLLGDLLGALRQKASAKQVMKLEQYIQSIGEACELMQGNVRRLFQSVLHLLDDLRSNRSSDYVTQVRIEGPQRERSTFARLQESYSTLSQFFETIVEALGNLTGAVRRQNLHTDEQVRDPLLGLEDAASLMQEAQAHLQRFIVQPEANAVYWISIGQGSNSPTLHSAPLHIGPMMREYLWEGKEAVVLTSATLRAQDDFNYIRERLHAENVRTLEVGSPFNYRESTMVYVPNDIPEPNDRKRYQQTIERTIIELAAALQGRVMALFTSYTQLRQTAQAVTGRLALGDITVYDQSDGTSRQALLEGFKSTEKAILLGTKSFWEGVDVPGESLSALVITRLPFAVPSDPVFASRAETYADSFNQYNLPDAILRFRQGFGRLIRRQSDRGIVVILDARVSRRSYGAQFLSALPDCEVKDGSLDDLADTARKWLNL